MIRKRLITLVFFSILVNICYANSTDTTAPKIELLGDKNTYITLGDKYIEQGVKATDDEDGDITDSVIITDSSVDTSTLGTYKITYNVSDSAGNKASEVTRTVVVGKGILLGSEDWEGKMTSEVQPGGFYWDGTWGKITTDPENSTNKVLRFTYKADEGRWQEKRFGFSEPQKNLWIKYRVHIPSNWKYRIGGDGENNKGFILLWGGDYGNPDIHTRTEFWRIDENTARISCAWHTENKKGTGGHSRMDSDGRYHPIGITANDRGKWMDVVMHVKFSDKGKSNGAFEIWKNGSILASWRNLKNAQDDDSLVDGVDQGYFFGYHNSGYNEETTYLFDDMKFGTTAQSIGFTIPNAQKDTQAPNISLIGEQNIYLTVGDTYTEKGASAEDDVDGDISEDIIISNNNLDTSTAGTYTITYKVSDSSGNTTELNRTITVGYGVLLGSENWEEALTTEVQANGFYWDSTWGKIATDPNDSSNKVLSFTYKANEGKWQQKKFNFTKAQKSIWTSYRLYIPSNWKYKATGNAATNNQGFIRLWGGKASNPTCLTQSVFWRLDNDNARITTTWHTENRKGTGGHSRVDSDGNVNPIGISSEDKGKWIDIVTHTKISDKGETNGMFEIWKNGSLLASWRNLPNAPDDEAQVDGINQGYFFGYHNTGYDEDTTYFFDDMKFGTTAQSIGFDIPNEQEDTKAPEINLIGEDNIYITVGGIYTEKGATASDNIDGDISAYINIAGDNVDTSTLGTYKITYNVSDNAGNKATEVTRTVVVGKGILLGSEDWEEGMTTKPKPGGFYWIDDACELATDPNDSTNKVLKYKYVPKEEKGSWREKRFAFLKPQKELWISYRVYIPSNWKYRLGGEGKNNKGFIKVWAGDYQNATAHVSTEFWRIDDNTARITGIWHKENIEGKGGHSNKDSDGRQNPIGINKQDIGKWMKVAIHIKFSDKGKSNGAFEIWKNGSILASWRNLTNAPDDGAIDGVDQGYIFGYHNSGYDEYTTYFFDDMKFGTTAQSIGFTIP